MTNFQRISGEENVQNFFGNYFLTLIIGRPRGSGFVHLWHNCRLYVEVVGLYERPPWVYGWGWERSHSGRTEMLKIMGLTWVEPGEGFPWMLNHFARTAEATDNCRWAVSLISFYISDLFLFLHFWPRPAFPDAATLVNPSLCQCSSNVIKRWKGW